MTSASLDMIHNQLSYLWDLCQLSLIISHGKLHFQIWSIYGGKSPYGANIQLSLIISHGKLHFQIGSIYGGKSPYGANIAAARVQDRLVMENYTFFFSSVV
jgi:hypothetical protein